MALTDCRECDGEVSLDAEACPHCGAPHPAEDQKTARKLQKRREGGSDAVAGGILSSVMLIAAVLLLAYMVWRFFG